MTFTFIVLLCVTITTRIHASFVAPTPRNERTWKWQLFHHVLGLINYPCMIAECCLISFKKAGIPALLGVAIVFVAGMVLLPPMISPANPDLGDFKPFTLVLGIIGWGIGGYIAMAVIKIVEDPDSIADF